MARIIAIETSGGVSSVALSVDGECTCLIEKSGNEQTHRLTCFIEQLLKESNLSLAKDIDAIAVSIGPGSYTGLRIGVSLCKGLCMGAGKPLIAIGTLDALCYGALQTLKERKAHLVAMVDARRMEVYAASYSGSGEPLSPVEAMIIDHNSFAELEDKVIFGSGAAKCAQIMGAQMVDVELSARWLCVLAEAKYNQNAFEDVAYLEPSYVKDFVALTSQKKLF